MGATYPVTVDPVITEDQKVLPLQDAAGDLFGGAVDLDETVPGGPRWVVGAVGHDDNGKNSGSAYVFRFPDGGTRGASRRG